MPQKLNQKNVASFIGGLVTEAAELTFPENASIDELNCDLTRDGIRSRRKGLEYETGHVLSSFTVDESKAFATGTWYNAGGKNDYNLIAVQTGSTVRFYKSNKAPYSNQVQSFTVNLATYEVPGVDSSIYKCQFASLAGALVIASTAINTVYLTLDVNTNTLVVKQIEFRIRDFDWQTDLCELDASALASSITAARRYDTANAGWTGKLGSDALSTYISSASPTTGQDGTIVGVASGVAVPAAGYYPPLTHPWYSGKDSSGNFSLSSWSKIYSGTSLIGNGHFILDFFNQDRSAVSGFGGISPVVEGSRFSSVASYAGRMWYAGLNSGENGGKILYSRLIPRVKTESDCSILGECLQQNDPTSEEISDLLDTDGGEINIIDAQDIKKIYSFNQYLYIFASNGVWIIGGENDVFKPTSYFVQKVTNIGILNPESFVAAEGVPFWWSKYGIHTFSFDEVTARPQEQNLTISTIQSFWDDIDSAVRSSVEASYDPVNKTIFWAYPDNGAFSLNRKPNLLVLNIPLKAFYPWRLAAYQDHLFGLYFFDGYGDDQVEVSVVDGASEVVVDGSAQTVAVLQANKLEAATTQLAAFIWREVDQKITVGLFSSKDFVDYGVEPYESYAEAGYDFIGDLSTRKNAPYVTVYCRATEEEWEEVEDGIFTPLNPSSLILKAYWDFKKNYSTSQQVYRVKPVRMPDEENLKDNRQDTTVITTRVKVRGRGRSVRLRFESEEGKNFILLGYGVVTAGNDRF